MALYVPQCGLDAPNVSRVLPNGGQVYHLAPEMRLQCASNALILPQWGVGGHARPPGGLFTLTH